MRTPNGTAATTLFAGQAVARASFSFSVQRILRTPAYIVRLASAFALIACSAPVVEDPQAVVASVDMSEAHFRIYGGAEDDDADALPGVVALRIGMEGTFELCSGALIAANLVLTARHCVTRNLTSSVSCNENGKSSNGEHVAGDELPRNVGVYVGAAPRFGQHPDSIAKAIVSPPGPYLCDSDIALVVLDTPITSIEPLAVRRARPAAAGEIIRSVGYGQNDDKLPIGTRFRKDGVTVLAQGKAISASKTPLGLHEFEVGKSICQGDSGGPAISEETGAVIGVVSRGGHCDEDFGHIYTTTSGFDELFTQGFALAGAIATDEPSDATISATRTRSTTPAVSATAETASTNRGCSSSPLRSRSTGASLGLALAAAFVLRRRARVRA